MIQSVSISITILDVELAAEVEFEITVPSNGGSPPSLNHPGDPPEAAEFEVKSISLRNDQIEGAPPLTIPPWLDQVIAESEVLNEAIQEAEYEYRRDDDFPDYGNEP